MMETLDTTATEFEFSEDEILQELSRLGYRNVPASKLKEFQRDLKLLIQHDKSTSYNTSVSSYYQDESDIETGPPMKITISRDSQSNDNEDDDEIESPKQHINIIKSQGRKSQQPTTSGNSTRGNFQLYKKQEQDIPDDVSETDSDIRRLVKRKTVRKSEKGGKFIDESMTESDAGSIIDAHERLQKLALRDFDDMQIDRRPRSYRNSEEPPYRLASDDPRPASVILRSTEHPHTKNLRKSDPVARYQQFKQVWQNYKAPGEKDHKYLRWNIREKMSVQEVPEKKNHRVYVQNKYTVPSDKQRKSLRWQVRMDMAQGVKPPSGFYHEY
ncbi:hypothetical protein LOTGIDRAFT_156759 [Lottia gigantea]|uniref:Centriolar and ciliogenesis-associated protein HYLS1 C-terminal domain-containing protein n=1 Tax=Lottia gigantea TaxID=225164 RepID=V4AYR6_LOTGI|nr:hypothetical protein LOTGIDRAFT_156759 [Lottia gigantea]ESP02813.1 hypothetical protein LOTGIDRAFT_156759 [Lottia gigantea]